MTTKYIPLMQFVLGRRHKELKERYQPPCVARKQSVPQPLLHLLDIFHKSNQLIIVVQQIISGSIQLLHHLCHPAVMALTTMTVSQLTVWTPARRARTN